MFAFKFFIYAQVLLAMKNIGSSLEDWILDKLLCFNNQHFASHFQHHEIL
jgi:hypothetical protein